MYFLASDHAGVDIKDFASGYLARSGVQAVDLTPTVSGVDYPDIADVLCKEVLNNEGSFGILVCGTGIGVSIAANRYRGIRAALCCDPYMAMMAREHNNANVLCLGQRVVGIGLVEAVLDAFVKAKFKFGKHTARVDKLDR